MHDRDGLKQILASTRHLWDRADTRPAVRQNFEKVINCGGQRVRRVSRPALRWRDARTDRSSVPRREARGRFHRRCREENTRRSQWSGGAAFGIGRVRCPRESLRHRAFRPCCCAPCRRDATKRCRAEARRLRRHRFLHSDRTTQSWSRSWACEAHASLASSVTVDTVNPSRHSTIWLLPKVLGVSCGHSGAGTLRGYSL